MPNMEPPDVMDFDLHDYGQRGQPVEYETIVCEKITNLKPFRKTYYGFKLKLGEPCYKVTRTIEMNGQELLNKVRYLSEEEYMIAKLKGETDKWLHSSAR